uniref:PGAP2IP C-terminal nuclease-like domain-containing protein n=1 Tax=Romanomermis culicivorax TaxID=13658 RepID=A0A915IWH8_ROMCU
MGNNDLAQWLAETLNMYVDYGPATKKHTWGCIVLSKFPIVSSEHYLLPSPFGELAPALSATLKVGRRNLTVIVTHMGNDRDDLDRKLQAEFLSDLSANLTAKEIGVIFLGYVTSKPFDRDYQTFMNRGKLKDIDSSDGDRFCEYIFYQNLKRLSYARISKSRLSDTEIQVAKFDLDSGKGGDNDITLKANEILDGKFLSKNALFPPNFGDFYRGHYSGADHRYHMSTPKYFIKNEA